MLPKGSTSEAERPEERKDADDGNIDCNTPLDTGTLLENTHNEMVHLIMNLQYSETSPGSWAVIPTVIGEETIYPTVVFPTENGEIIEGRICRRTREMFGVYVDKRNDGTKLPKEERGIVWVPLKIMIENNPSLRVLLEKDPAAMDDTK